jgi:hypothetical protein
MKQPLTFMAYVLVVLLVLAAVAVALKRGIDPIPQPVAECWHGVRIDSERLCF